MSKLMTGLHTQVLQQQLDPNIETSMLVMMDRHVCKYLLSKGLQESVQMLVAHACG